jgi:DHA1 family inner membrane transport protein
MKINFPLLALAIGAFGIGTTEFSPMGLLPVIARGVDVSIPAAGMLISAYAIGVMVGAPLMTLLLSHRARRNALIFLMAIFTLGNVLSAISPDYTTLMLSRILTSLNHGAFFGLGSVVAASVVPKQAGQRGGNHVYGADHRQYWRRACGTWLGEAIGWRMSFLATAGLGVVAMVACSSPCQRQRR